MKKKLAILLLEDNSADARLLERALSKSFDNFQIKVIETKEEYLTELSQPYDIIISDYAMPTFDGMEALKIKNKKKPFLPFIITTGSTNEATAVDCMKAGADDYIIKEHITRIGEAVKRAISLKKTQYEKQKAEFNIHHLNRILKAIRNINQLITHEHVQQKLIQQACEMLTTGESYTAAWISLFDENNRLGKIVAFSGYEPNEFQPLAHQLQQDIWPPCLKTVYKSGKQTSIKHTNKIADQCPLAKLHLSATAFCQMLTYKNKKLGFITVVLPKDMTTNKEEEELFREVSGDISYALFNMETEKENRETALRQKVLYEIAHAATSEEELNDFLSKVFNIIKKAINFNYGYVAIHNEKKNQYYFPLQYNREETDDDLLPDHRKGMINYVRKKGKLTVLKDTQLKILIEKKEIEQIGPISAVWMGTPLISRGNFIGVMALMNRKNKHAFSKKDEALMEFISTQLALFIERKDTLLKLKASNERYKTVMQKANDCIFLFDMSGNIVNTNTKAEKSLGYSSDELMKLNVLNLVPAIIVEKQKEKYWDHFALGEVIVFETIFLRKNGTEFPVEINSGIVKIGDEEFVLSIARDISERKASEEKIRQLSLGVEQSPASIVITDLEGAIQYVNKKFTEVSGYTEKEALGQNPRVLKSGKMPDSLYKELWSTISAGKEWRGEIINRRKDQSFYWELVSISPVKNYKEEITHYIAVKEDITGRKEMETALKRAKQRAEESDKLKSEFLANISHEIRTPMNGIIGFTSLLDDEELSPESRKNYINIIQNSTRQLLHIIDEILEISKLQAHQEEKKDQKVNINEMLIKCFSEFDEVAKNKDLSLYVKKGLPDEAALVYVDEKRLHKIIDHLVENALKFTQQGHVELGYTFKGDNLEFYVKDTGDGISKEAQQLIFEQFSQEDKRLSRVSGGLGLGLSIVKGNVTLLSGTIRLESEKGTGSTFFVKIPYQPVNPGARVQKAIETASAKSRMTVLVTEDEEINYQYLEILLKKYNTSIRVLHAINGKEAVELCQKHPEIKMVLMDIKMPEMGGLEATRLIKAQHPNLAVVAQTAYTALENQEEAQEAGCSAFLRKPTRKVHLFKILDRFLKEPKK